MASDPHLSPDRFRNLFPALRERVWLSTPGVAPGAEPVLHAVELAVEEWRMGSFDWRAWEAEADATRGLFAGLVGAQNGSIALTATLADAAATVANYVAHAGRRGAVVVGGREFRSNLLPWLALASRERDIVQVAEPADGGWTERILEAVRPGTALVALTEVQSATGARLDLSAVAGRCSDVGALCFVNLTQSAGILPVDVEALGIDFAAAHGYKWLLAPRGATWLYVRPDHLPAMRALAPNWKNAEDPYGELYGPVMAVARHAGRLDGSLAWFPWVGARAALELVRRLPAERVERHCLALAGRLRAALAAQGLQPLIAKYGDPQSHIVTAAVHDAEQIGAALARRGISMTVRDRRLRFGMHYFNSDQDVDFVADAVAEAVTRPEGVRAEQ